MGNDIKIYALAASNEPVSGYMSLALRPILLRFTPQTSDTHQKLHEIRYYCMKEYEQKR